MKDLEPFYPDRMASRILGMGNVVSLVEKPAAEVSDVEASAMTKSMSNAMKFTNPFFPKRFFFFCSLFEFWMGVFHSYKVSSNFI